MMRSVVVSLVVVQISLVVEFVSPQELQQPPVKLFGQYIHKDYKKRYNSDEDDTISVTEYPPLKEFLEKYTNRNQNKFKKPDINGDDGKSKTWDLLHVSQYNPQVTNDKKGWVTLEAVPWSISKVSKWQSNVKPHNSNWDDIETDNHHHWTTTKPYYHHNFNSHRPDPRPSYVPSGGINFDFNRPYHKDDEESIITDGRPANFPKIPEKTFNRRQSSTDLPMTYPSNGDGEWILLSTTKGYKYPKRQRSLTHEPESVSTTRSVHLTVLPPTGNSKVNMTTSHGGLLEVESTFETVEESQRKERMKRMKAKTPAKALQQEHQEVEQVVTAAVKKPPKKATDSSAVMAAVGAGIIPATMAMLVPMAMNGRRRRSLDFGGDEMNFRLRDFD